jgi:hypothetical protein
MLFLIGAHVTHVQDFLLAYCHKLDVVETPNKLDDYEDLHDNNNMTCLNYIYKHRKLTSVPVVTRGEFFSS